MRISRPNRSRASTPDALRAAGLHIVSNFQYGKPGWPDPSDFTRGYDGGVADAQTALRLHARPGYGLGARSSSASTTTSTPTPGMALLSQWFRGINSVLGVERTGIYGHAQACGWAIRDGVIGQSTTAGHRWAWQTKSSSHGEREPMAVLYQAVVNTPSNPGPLLGGIDVDVDDVLAGDYGQWDFPDPMTTRPPGRGSWECRVGLADRTPGYLQVEPVVVHDLDPRRDEVLHELPLVVVLRVDLGQSAQHRVRAEHKVIGGRGPLLFARGPVAALVDVLRGLRRLPLVPMSSRLTKKSLVNAPGRSVNTPCLVPP